MLDHLSESDMFITGVISFLGPFKSQIIQNDRRNKFSLGQLEELEVVSQLFHHLTTYFACSSGAAHQNGLSGNVDLTILSDYQAFW